jgi:hypothetical protein
LIAALLSRENTVPSMVDFLLITFFVKITGFLTFFTVFKNKVQIIIILSSISSLNMETNVEVMVHNMGCI